MLEKTYRLRIWPIITFLLYVPMGLLRLKLNPSLALDPKFWSTLMLFFILAVLYYRFYKFSYIEIHTLKLILRIGGIRYYYYEIPWDEVTWLEDDYCWPLYATHVRAYKDVELRSRIKKLAQKEAAGLKTKENFQEFNKEIKEIKKLRRGKESIITFVNPFMKGYKDFNQELIFRSPSDTVVPCSLLKRLGLTQSDIGKLYKQPETP